MSWTELIRNADNNIEREKISRIEQELRYNMMNSRDSMSSYDAATLYRMAGEGRLDEGLRIVRQNQGFRKANEAMLHKNKNNPFGR